MSLSLSEGVELCEEIVEMIDDEIPDHAWNKAAEFFEDVRAKAIGVRETLGRTGWVSEGQERALNNWRDGVRKWIHDDDD